MISVVTILLLDSEVKEHVIEMKQTEQKKLKNNKCEGSGGYGQALGLIHLKKEIPRSNTGKSLFFFFNSSQRKHRSSNSTTFKHTQ